MFVSARCSQLHALCFRLMAVLTPLIFIRACRRVQTQGGSHVTPPAAMICIGLCLVFECVTASLILGTRNILGSLFVDDTDVVRLVSKLA